MACQKRTFTARNYIVNISSCRTSELRYFFKGLFLKFCPPNCPPNLFFSQKSRLNGHKKSRLKRSFNPI